MALDRSKLWLNDPGNFTGYSQVLEEYEGNSASSVALKTTFTLGDDVLSQSNATGVRHFLYDGHGSTRTLTDAVGAVTDTFHYDSYGVDLAPNRTDDKKFGPVNQASTSLRYSGEWVDDHMQQQYLRARWYDPKAAVFNRLDDHEGGMTEPQSLHKYAYCHCDPVNAIDPSGNITLLELQIANFIQMTIVEQYTEATAKLANKMKTMFGGSAALNMLLAAIQIVKIIQVILAIYMIFKIGIWIIRNFKSIFSGAAKLWRLIRGGISRLRGARPTGIPTGTVTVARVLQTGERVGDAGEDIAKNLLSDRGYRNIMPIQNNSGHGIDLVAQDASNRWVFFEVKASGGPRAPRLSNAQTDMPSFVNDRLSRAVGGQGHWRHASADTRARAQLLQDWLAEGNIPEGGKIEVTNLSSGMADVLFDIWD